MRVEEVESEVLAAPVIITLETVKELEWAYTAFSNAVHAKGVAEDSPQQRMYCAVHVALNNISVRYR
jgi:hypothetical protein